LPGLGQLPLAKLLFKSVVKVSGTLWGVVLLLQAVKSVMTDANMEQERPDAYALVSQIFQKVVMFTVDHLDRAVIITVALTLIWLLFYEIPRASRQALVRRGDVGDRDVS
jgi:hypothetical protein